jgi:uncharacterized cupin superfamily protein
MTDVAPVTPPVIDTAFLAVAASAELEDWGPVEEATSADIPRGWRGPWVIHETGRKVYVIF